MTRGKGSKGHSSKELWIDHEPQGQPSWDGHGFIRDPHIGSWERRQYEVDMLSEVEEVIKRIGEWVLQQNNEMWTVVWFQSLRREILTGEKASEEGIIRVAKMHVGHGLYTILRHTRKDGTVIESRLRPKWEQWYDNFRKAESRLKKKLQPVLKKLLGV